MAYTNAATIVDERLPGHRGPRRPVLRLRPGDRPLRPDDLAVRRRPRTWTRTSSSARSSSSGTSAPAPTTQASHEAARSESHGSGGAPVGWKGRRDETLQHPRCVFQILKRHFARYTPEMVQQVCGIEPEQFPQVADALTSNSGRERTTAFCYAVGLDPAQRRRADDPHRRDPADAAGQHRPPGRRDHGAARPRQHPGVHRHPDPVQHPARLPPDAARRRSTRPRRVRRGRRGQGRVLGQHALLRREPAEVLLGRRGHGRERLLLRLPAAASPATTRRTTRSRRRSRAAARATSWSGRTPPSGRRTARCSGSAWPTSTGWWCATCR